MIDTKVEIRRMLTANRLNSASSERESANLTDSNMTAKFRSKQYKKSNFFKNTLSPNSKDESDTHHKFKRKKTKRKSRHKGKSLSQQNDPSQFGSNNVNKSEDTSYFNSVHQSGTPRKQDEGLPEIMVVDDSPFILLTMEEKIKRYGYACDKALSGEEAIMLCQKRMADGKDIYRLIIMDIQMPPGIDGQVAMERIHKEVDEYIK